MVRLYNDSQNLALRGAANATSSVASQRAQDTQRSSALEARSRIASASSYLNANAQSFDSGFSATGSSGAKAQLEDNIINNFEASKALKEYYENKVASLTAQGEPSSDYERNILTNHRAELSLYQSATEFWSTERKTSYQYTEEDVPQVIEIYDQIKALETNYDSEGTALFEIFDKTKELYKLKEGGNPFGETATVDPAEEQAITLLRVSAAKGRNLDSQNQVNKWLAYNGADEVAASKALEAAKEQVQFSDTSIAVWENRFKFWNDISEQAYFIEDSEKLDKMQKLLARMSELEGILDDWLSKTDDIDTARSKSSETLGLIGDLEIEIRRLFI